MFNIRPNIMREFRCDTCKQEFTRRDHLKRHISKGNCGLKSSNLFECGLCEKSYTRKINLLQHRATIHPSNYNLLEVSNVYSCDVCKLQFQKQDNLKKHRKLHDLPKKFLHVQPLPVCSD